MLPRYLWCNTKNSDVLTCINFYIHFVIKIQNNDKFSILFKVLTNNEHQDDGDIISSINQRMTNGTFEDDLDKSLKLNDECVKSQLDISKKKNNETRFSNGFQSECSLDNVSKIFKIIICWK